MAEQVLGATEKTPAVAVSPRGIPLPLASRSHVVLLAAGCYTKDMLSADVPGRATLAIYIDAATNYRGTICQVLGD